VFGSLQIYSWILFQYWQALSTKQYITQSEWTWYKTVTLLVFEAFPSIQWFIQMCVCVCVCNGSYGVENLVLEFTSYFLISAYFLIWGLPNTKAEFLLPYFHEICFLASSHSALILKQLCHCDVFHFQLHVYLWSIQVWVQGKRKQLRYVLPIMWKFGYFPELLGDHCWLLNIKQTI
jgi:hypothetical protein